MNLEDDKQARRDLAALLKKNAGDIKVPVSLRERGREMMLAKEAGAREAIKSVARLIRKHKFLSLLSDSEIEAACLEAAGLKQRAPRPAVTGPESNAGR